MIPMRRIKWVAMVLVVAAPFCANAQEEGNALADTRLTLSAPVTHSDWMLRDGVAWGPEGVRHMLDQCKASGWSRVYWRALDGGRSLYKSDLMDPQGTWDADNFWNPASEQDLKLLQAYTDMSAESRKELLAKLERYDYGTFDTLAEAVRYGHEIGLEVHAWLSINEDDHGWGLVSRFSREHPEFRWVKRDGTPYRSQLSFAFPEVVEYKLAIIREILDKYPVDGIFLDWIRTGDVRDNPQTDADGVADHGYEEPMVTGFAAKYGVDPRSLPNGDDRWVRFRAEPHTGFVRAARRLISEKRPGLPLTAMVANPWCYRGMKDKIDGSLRGLLLDVATWAQEGLIDGAVATGYYLEGNAESACAALREETGGKIDVWYFGWVPSTPDEFLNDFQTAQRLGVKQILFWEGDYIDGKPNKAELQAIMSQHALFAQKPPEKPEYELLLCGEYHGDEVTAVTGDKWWGLLRTEAGFELREVEITVESVHDICMDNDESEKSGKKVSVESQGLEPVMLVRGPAFSEPRPVPTCLAATVPLVPTDYGHFVKLSLGSEPSRVTLVVMGKTAERHWSDYEVTFCFERGDEGWQSFPFIQRERAFNPGLPALHWAGDIDGDGKMDLLMNMRDHYSVWEMTLFLSTEAAADQPPKPCAVFRTVGC